MASTFKVDTLDVATKSTGVFPTQTGTATFGIDESAGTQLSIANDATATPFGNANNFSGLLMINDPESTGGMGLFIIGASSTVVLISQAGSLFTTTQGTASSVNVYANAGVITIENKRGATIGFRVFAIRMRNSG